MTNTKMPGWDEKYSETTSRSFLPVSSFWFRKNTPMKNPTNAKGMAKMVWENLMSERYLLIFFMAIVYTSLNF
jgi:hypothetical protein